jgi:integrase
MSIFKRPGSPYYYAEFTISGHRIVRSTRQTTERAARAEERRLKTEIAAQLAKPKRAEITVDEACGRYWMEHGAKLRWSAEVERHLKLIVESTGSLLLLSMLDDSHVNALVQSRSEQGAGPAGINRTLAVFRQVHNRARKKWKCVVQEIDWPEHWQREPRGRVRWLTTDEAASLLQCLPDRVRLPVRWSLATGARKAETFALKWDDVDLIRRTATVMVKGGHQRAFLIEGDAFDVINETPRIGPYVFESRNVRKIFEAALAKAGLEDFRWHDLRHTHASWLRQRSAKLDVVQRSLDHAAVTTTQRYAHVDDGELRDALRALPTFSTNTSNVLRLKR